MSACFALLLAHHLHTWHRRFAGVSKKYAFSPEHKQKLADDISRYRNADNLWDVLREEFSLPHYENNPAVQDKINWYMNNQDFLLRSATRAAPYLYYILEQSKNVTCQLNWFYFRLLKVVTIHLPCQT